MGWKLGKIFPSCLNILVPEHGSKEGRLLKMLVEVDLEKPLLRGTHLQLERDSVWVSFRYEQLPQLCYYCGRLGHLEKNCERKLCVARSGSILE